MFVDKPKHKKTSEPEKTNTYVKQGRTKRVDPVVVKEDYYCEQLAFDL